MAGSDVFGPSVSAWTIETAVLKTLSTPPSGGTVPLLVYYLADQERQVGLPARTLPVPPGPSSYRGGVDTETLKAEWFPMVHVNVAPNGAPTMLDMDTYSQGWSVTLTATHGDDDEDIARRTVFCFNTALALLMVQHGTLGIGATKTIVTRILEPQLLDPVNNRQVCRAALICSTTTTQSLTVAGPNTWPRDPYTPPGDWPAISTVDLTVNATA